MEGVGDKDKTAINHVPFIEGQIIDVIGDEVVVRYAQGLKHRLLPETTTAFDSSKGIDDAESQNTFDRS